MADTTPDVMQPDSSPDTTPIEETPAFKEAVAKARDDHRKNLDAEYARKQREWEAANAPRTPQEPAPTGGDFFDQFEQKYGVPKDGVRELTNAILTTVQTHYVAPLNAKAKDSTLRGQRQELRASKPKLAALDDRYHAEVLAKLKHVAPDQIGDTTYETALHLVIGEHFDDLDTETKQKTEARTDTADREIVGPSPSSRGTTLPPKAKVALTAFQQRQADQMGYGQDHDSYADIMRTRARRFLNEGMTKEQVRVRLGQAIQGLDF